MKTFAVSMLSLSLAGLVAAGSVAAQQPAPKQCQPAKAPQRVEGQVVEMSSLSDAPIEAMQPIADEEWQE